MVLFAVLGGAFSFLLSWERAALVASSNISRQIDPRIRAVWSPGLALRPARAWIMDDHPHQSGWCATVKYWTIFNPVINLRQQSQLIVFFSAFFPYSYFPSNSSSLSSEQSPYHDWWSVYVPKNFLIGILAVLMCTKILDQGVLFIYCVVHLICVFGSFRAHNGEWVDGSVYLGLIYAAYYI